MDGETDREAMIQDLTQEIARCRRVIENISDKKTLVRLSAYLCDLERALEAQMSEEDPGISSSVSRAISPETAARSKPHRR
jgi:hypothetical protein